MIQDKVGSHVDEELQQNLHSLKKKLILGMENLSLCKALPFD